MAYNVFGGGMLNLNQIKANSRCVKLKYSSSHPEFWTQYLWVAGGVTKAICSKLVSVAAYWWWNKDADLNIDRVIAYAQSDHQGCIWWRRVRGVDPQQEVADPQKVLQNLFGGSTLTP